MIVLGPRSRRVSPVLLRCLRRHAAWLGILGSGPTCRSSLSLSTWTGTHQQVQGWPSSQKMDGARCRWAALGCWTRCLQARKCRGGEGPPSVAGLGLRKSYIRFELPLVGGRSGFDVEFRQLVHDVWSQSDWTMGRDKVSGKTKDGCRSGPCVSAIAPGPRAPSPN